jgi:hypothetical protein
MVNSLILNALGNVEIKNLKDILMEPTKMIPQEIVPLIKKKAPAQGLFLTDIIFRNYMSKSLQASSEAEIK